MKHKLLGQVYSPAWIVNEILDLVGYDKENILNKYILEPACGDGAFLKEIVTRYIDIAQQNNIDNKHIIEHLEKYIYGIEIDEYEYNKCLHNLNEIVKKKLNIEAIHWNIFNENTLYIFDKYLSFFDYIVGNPPYIRIHHLDNNTRDFLKNHFLFADGTIDIYLSFFEMALKMLKPDGIIGYITPNSYLHNASYTSFRDFLKRKRILNTLIDFKSNKIFKGYSTYTAITILQNNYNKDFFIYKELLNEKIVTINEIQFDKLNIKDWSFSNKMGEAFLSSLLEKGNAAVKDFFEVQYGFATLRDKIFIAQVQAYQQDTQLVLFNDCLIEKSILKEVVKGSRYKGENNNNNKIIFPYELISNKYIVIAEEKLKQNYPYCYAYFLSYKDELMSRDLDKGALWYEYGRSQGVQSIHQEKIILSTLVNGKIDFYKLSKDTLMYSGIFITKKNLHTDWTILEEVLASEDFFNYIRLTGKDFSGGYKSITTKQIKEFKINFNNNATLF